MAEFIRVVPSEVEQHGPAAAIVLAHIRFRCASDGPGRIQREGHRWWRVTQTDLGREVGLTRKAVMAALQALGEAVSAKHFPPLANQSRAYRLVESADALTSQCPDLDRADQPVSGFGQPESEIGLSSVRNGTDPCPDSDTALPIENLEKEGEAAGSRQAAAPPPSSKQSANGKPTYHPRCPNHIHVERPPACPGCRDARVQAEEHAVAAQSRADNRRRVRRDEITSCPDCDQNGWIEADTGVKRCPRHDWSHLTTGATA